MSTRRDDLLALTRPALVSLANVGFVKRAEKDLAEGPRPALDLLPDGTLTAAFADGAKVTLPSGRGLRDSPCSACTTPMCRHRIAAVLTYQAEVSASSTSEPPTVGARAPGASPPPWSPGQVADGTLEKLLGAGALARASNLRRRGGLAEVRRGTFEGDDLPHVQLATSTVRFLVPRDITHARCDCTLRTACEHVALAIWAFRAADAKDPAAKVLVVELQEGRSSGQPPALDASLDVAAAVLLEGAVHLGPAAPARVLLARRALEEAGLAWPLAAVEELETLTEAYRRRSARYSSERLSAVIAELFARARCASGGGQVPARAVLGADEVLEARLDQLRLAGLGARIEADGEDRVAEIYLADPGSAGVLVLERRFQSTNEPGHVLANRPVLAGTPLAAVAAGQVVSNAAVRRASRTVTFSTGPLKKTSVLRGAPDLEVLPAALVVDRVEPALEALRTGVPTFLAPRLVAQGLRAVRVAAVEAAGYEEGAQTIRARCSDGHGGAIELALSHRTVAPGALGALARALAEGAVRGVVGLTRAAGGLLAVEPIAVLTTTLVVLDLEPPTAEGDRALRALPHLRAAPVEDVLREAIHRAEKVIEDAAHQGLRDVPPAWRERLRAAGARLRDVGLGRAAADLEALEHRHAAARMTGTDDDERAAVEAWVTAALRLELLDLGRGRGGTA